MKTICVLLALGMALLASAARAELENENLLVKVPAGFKIDFQQKNKDMMINEMVPDAESVNDWTQMVTVQVFYNLKATPEQFKSKMEAGMLAACPGSESYQIAQGDENGYPAVVWLQSCPLNKATGKPEMTWIKGIQGNDSFYVVQLAFKAWPSKEQITEWMQYLKGVAVCDTRLPDRPCAQAPTWNAPAAGVAQAAAAAVGAASPAAKLTGRAAWNALVGNSITGEDDGATLVEYYAPNGTAKSKSGKDVSTGTWTVRGDQVCFKYPREAAACYTVEVSGDAVTFYEKDGSGSRYTLLKGNPNKL